MSAKKEASYIHILNQAILTGEKILRAGGTAVTAVEEAVKQMEDSPLFNAGKGSVFTSEGKNEMDASIMDGLTLKAGSVVAVSHIKNPVSAARQVMEHSSHVMLAGMGAEQFAQQRGCKLEEPSYFYTEERFLQLQLAQQSGDITLDHNGANKMATKNTENGGRKLGTVGAVALDTHGNLAAATSTGGMTNKHFGRIGDSPIIGAGTYANNNTCAVSCTGHGEYFLRNVVAYDISALMEYKQLELKKAADYVIHEKLKNQDCEGGIIALDKKGNCSMTFNTPGMYRAMLSAGKKPEVKIYQ